MSRRQRRRVAFTAAQPPPPEATATPARALPPELVLEIVARSDAATILRCAASCKPLCRDIASPAFLRRVFQSHDNFTIFVSAAAMRRGSPPPPPPPPFSLAHPATPAAAHLSERHLAPFVSRAGAAADLLARYELVTSRGGLAVLRRRRLADVPRESGLCVYDPMTGRRAFLPDPPEMADYSPGYDYCYSYVLLTASDGIGRRFLLLAADFAMLMYPASSIDVLTVFSPDAAAGAAGGEGKWSPVTSVKSHRRSHCSALHPYCGAVVIVGIVHWVMNGGRDQLHVLTYDVGAATAGSIELPVSRLPSSYRERYDANLRLAASPEGMLTVLVRDKLTVTVWRLCPGDGGGWARHAVIDTEPSLRSLLPGLSPSTWEHGEIQLKSVGERSGVVLFDLEEEGRRKEEGFMALDVETKEMHRVNSHDANVQALLFEIDLESRLSAMKIS